MFSDYYPHLSGGYPLPNNKPTQPSKKSYQTRLNIIDAYINLVQFKDFDTITVKAIAEEANITRGTFYLYFADIYELVTYIENTLLTEMPNTPVARQYVVDKLSFPSYEICQDNDFERQWFTYYNKNHKYFNTLLGPHGDASFANKIKRSIQNALKIKMRQDGMHDDHLQKYFIELIPNLYLLLAREWTDAKEAPLDIEAVIAIISTIRIGSLYHDSLMTQRALNRSSKKE